MKISKGRLETASLTTAGSTSPITDDTGDGDGDSERGW